MSDAKACDLLVTGAGGQLGRAVLAEASRRGLRAHGSRHGDMPVEDPRAVHAEIGYRRPAAVVHAGAWTDVDGCERDPERAEAVNGRGTANVASACAEFGIRLAYVSTDFVFDGEARTPYAVDAPCAPLSAYGRSKRSGEIAVLAHGRRDFHVVRTSWVFGPGGKNFPSAILARARAGEPLKVVDDQSGSPTFTLDLAAALLDLLATDTDGGIWHAANDGVCTWHRFATEILAAAGLGHVEVGRTTSAELGRPARRPAWSALDCARLTALRGHALPPYSDAIRRHLALEKS
jgi:dTDP-4-dehydrorhamnose reductase